jgi:hypothetical protein
MQFGTPEFSSFVAACAAIVSTFSALVSLLSVFVARKNWLDSNRPVVTAYIDEDSEGEGITVFNLHLGNSGTRPATFVQLCAHPSDVQKLLDDEAEFKHRKNIERVFTPESRVAILHPGETLVTSFGLASANPAHKWLKYGEEIATKIRYCDVEGNAYVSHISLKIRPREGFGGGVWRGAS